LTSPGGVLDCPAMADEKRRLVSLTVVGGPLDGQHCLPEEVVGELLIGSDPACQLALELPGVSPIHARLWTALDSVTVRDTHAPRGVFVNDTRVATEMAVGENDLVWLGPPGEPDSVCLKPAFAPWVEVLPIRPPDDPFYVGEETALPAPAPAADSGSPATAVRQPAVSPAVAVTPAREAGPEPMLLVQDDLVALAGAVAADGLVEATEAAGEPEVDPADDFFVAEEPPAAPAPGPVAPPSRPSGTAPVPIVQRPPAATRAAGAPAAGGPAVVATPRVSPPSQTTRPAPLERPAVVTPRPSPGLSPDRTAPRLVARAAAPASRRPPASAARVGGRAVPHRQASGAWVRLVAIGLGGVVLVAAGLAGWRLWAAGTVRLESVTPVRLRAGQRAVLTGRGFKAETAGNVVLFDAERARVLSAAADRLEVEVPAAGADTATGEQRVAVVVRTGARASAPVEVTLLQGPRLHGLSPLAAMPGEEVTLAGSGWGPGATVRFGPAAAEIRELDATRIRVVVPAIDGSTGTSAPVVVEVAGIQSNAAPFVVGHPPVVSGISPETAGPGDVVQVAGVGFEGNPLLDDVRIGGVPALVVSATPDSLGVVVPHLGPGEATRALEVRLPGSANVGAGKLAVPVPSPAGLRFVAEPFIALPGRPHAVVATGIGPVFVLAASGGRSAAQRALEAEQRLNAAVEPLRTTLGLTLEARFEPRPLVGLGGRPEPLLEVTDEDAAAYNEDWTRLRGRGGAVTPGRLLRWWEALGRDLVLLELRGERPHFAAALAPEGRALVQLFDLAQKSGRPPSSPEVMAQARPPLREGLRLLALRVPAGVAAPAPPVAAGPAASPVRAETPRLSLEGSWRGSELEEGSRRYLTVTFSSGSGSISYEGGLTLTMPLASLEPRGRDGVRFSVYIRGGTRYYTGKWDGEKLAGPISTDQEGREVVASFELRR